MGRFHAIPPCFLPSARRPPDFACRDTGARDGLAERDSGRPKPAATRDFSSAKPCHVDVKARSGQRAALAKLGHGKYEAEKGGGGGAVVGIQPQTKSSSHPGDDRSRAEIGPPRRRSRRWGYVLPHLSSNDRGSQAVGPQGLNQTGQLAPTDFLTSSTGTFRWYYPGARWGRQAGREKTGVRAVPVPARNSAPPSTRSRGGRPGSSPARARNRSPATSACNIQVESRGTHAELFLGDEVLMGPPDGGGALRPPKFCRRSQKLATPRVETVPLGGPGAGPAGFDFLGDCHGFLRTRRRAGHAADNSKPSIRLTRPGDAVVVRPFQLGSRCSDGGAMTRNRCVARARKMRFGGRGLDVHALRPLCMDGRLNPGQ